MGFSLWTSGLNMFRLYNGSILFCIVPLEWCIINFYLVDAKRLIGRKFDDPGVQSDMKHWPFEVINESSKPKLRVEYKGETKSFFPEEISSMVLNKMKETAEAFLGKVRIGV